MDGEEPTLSYECEKKPLKIKNELPKEVSTFISFSLFDDLDPFSLFAQIDFMSEVMRGRFCMTANINHGGRICTAKVFDKTDPEGDDAAKREFKNLKGLKHEKMVRFFIRALTIESSLKAVGSRFILQVSLVEAFETDKMCLLKFDTLPGTDVLTYLAEKPSYSEQMVAEIASQTVDALSYLQWRGKVYLNLEPGHIIVNSGRSLGKTLQVSGNNESRSTQLCLSFLSLDQVGQL